MKAIAEYFRDLSANDRYFGAEPPKLDSEILSLIAEREIRQPVDVRERGGAFVLSPKPTPAPSQEEVSQAQEEPLAEPEIQEEVVAEPEAQEEVVAEPEAQEEAIAEPEAQEEAIAAPEAQEEAVAEPEVQEEAVAEPEVQEEAVAEPEVQEEAVAEPEAQEEAVAEPEAQEEAVAAPEAQEEAVAEPEAQEEVVAEPEVQEEAIAEPEVQEEKTTADDNSIAAKLRRIREVVSQANFQKKENYSEDQHAEESQSAQISPEDTAKVETPPAEELAQAQTEETVSKSDSAQTQDEKTVSEENTAAEAPSKPRNKIKPSVSGIRVVKVKRSSLDQAIEQGRLEEIEEEPDEPEQDGIIDDITINSSLSPQEEEELARELAAAEAEADPESLFADPVNVPATKSIQQSLPDFEENSDDLTRLMAEADQQMASNEGKQTRSAFAHLRAAVAAKKAETNEISTASTKEEDAYRNDLASAVTKPAGHSDAAENTQSPEYLAPLQLVAEQRVDKASQTPVRPRRVTLEEDENTNDFAQFASSIGANDLPTLLEAAAAYMSFTEGRNQFSRPQLMNLVRSVEKEDFSREDGLRSFGQLLRAGKIEKIKGGRFTVTEHIGFQSDARAAG